MVVHHQDYSFHSDEAQHNRLEPARAVTQSGVPCMVWAEDALSFVHFVPTALFSLQLIVQDGNVDHAAEAIVSQLPFQRMSSPPEPWMEWSMLSPEFEKLVCYPRSIALKSTKSPENLVWDEPWEVWIHPQSYIALDITDLSLSVSLAPPLPSENESIRFPNRAAFLDGLANLILESPVNFAHRKFLTQVGIYAEYLLTYTLRKAPRVNEDGTLEPEHQMVMDSLRPENRSWFYSLAACDTSYNRSTEITKRKELLERMGWVDRYTSRRRCNDQKPLAAGQKMLRIRFRNLEEVMHYPMVFKRIQSDHRLFFFLSDA